MSVTNEDGLVITVLTDASHFQGISSASGLTAGMPVNMDLIAQSDGTTLATRVEVPDSSTTNLSVLSGPLLAIAASEPSLTALGGQQQGFLYFMRNFFGSQSFSFDKAAFAISGQFGNLKSLPFTPAFTANTLVPGQNVLLTTHATTVSNGPLYVPISTLTLIPQHLNGRITSIASVSGFSVYTVTLASYALFPSLAVQPGSNNLLSNPSTVIIYADNNTRMRVTTNPTVGGIFSFYGLVFNDNGTLRMDCAQIGDGVPQ